MPRNVELEHNSAVPEHVHAITLVRHGRTAYNAQHRLQGQIDIPLDEVGQWQVRQTADALRELYVDRRPDIPNRLVICSDLGRAAATAHAFADPLGLEVHPDIRVREPKEEVGRRGVEALNDWAFRAGSDTDLYVFSHGAWISQTLQTLLGMADAHGDFADILSMRNAHWVRLIPLEIGSTLRWRLMDYNHGPAIADSEEWEHSSL